MAQTEIWWAHFSQVCWTYNSLAFSWSFETQHFLKSGQSWVTKTKSPKSSGYLKTLLFWPHLPHLQIIFSLCCNQVLFIHVFKGTLRSLDEICGIYTVLCILVGRRETIGNKLPLTEGHMDGNKNYCLKKKKLPKGGLATVVEVDA